MKNLNSRILALASIFAVVSVSLPAAAQNGSPAKGTLYARENLSIIPSPSVTRMPWRAAEPIDQPTTDEDGEFEGNAEERQNWFMSQRLFPFTELPPEARRRAWDQKVEGLNRTANGLNLEWRPIGPRPTYSDFPNNWGFTSGRINAIAVSPANPDVLLVGAATGGIWRSTDGGANFNPVTDGHVDLAVGSIAFAPSNPQIVYAGMGDAGGGYLGSGLLKSTDGGATWSRISGPTLPAPGTVSRVVVDPTDHNRVYVAQMGAYSNGSLFSSGFLLSIDGGVTFTRTLIGLPRDIVVHPTNPDILYTAVQRYDGGGANTGGVWKSVNRGAAWTRVHTVPFATNTTNIKVAVTASAPESVYVLSASGSTAFIQVSPNGGTTWETRGSQFDTGQIGYNCYLFVHPADPATIFVGTRDLWRSTDGGGTFTNVTNNFNVAGSYNPTVSRSHPDQHHFYISPTNPSTFYVANDGGLSKTTNNGSTFTSLNATLGLTMFTGIAVHPSASLRVYGGTQDNGTQRRLEGSGWDEFISGDGGQTFLDPLDPGIVYTTYVYHSIRRFNNNGLSFGGTIGAASTFNSDRIAFYPPFVGNEVNSNLYFGTYRLYISTNRGLNWAAPGGAADLTNGSGTLSAIAVSRSDTNVIYTGASDGRVMVSTNGGVNWEQRTGGLPTRAVKSIVIDPTDPNAAYLTVSGFLAGHVFKTVNGGVSWTNISGNLPDIPVNTLLRDPRPGHPNTLYIGTDIGVFRSLDGGGSWESFNNGMPPVIVTKLVGQPNGQVLASTYGRGAYEINLNGSNPTAFDFDGDRKADLSVWRSSDKIWHLLRAIAGYTAMQWGVDGDRMVPADYDGDGKTDVAVFRPSNGRWYLYASGTQTFQEFSWGQVGDVPVPSDRDADGRADLVIYRPSDNTWYTRFANSTFLTVPFGESGDMPVRGDFDGDGQWDMGVYRPSNNNWYIIRSSLGYFIQTWGVPGDLPMTADFDGDGATDTAVFRPATGEWFLSRTSQGFATVNWGVAGDVPVPADYDGDGRADVAVFRPSEGNWYIVNSTAGILIQNFGQAGDVPTQNAFAF